MKVEQKGKELQPVTITLETEAELRAMERIMDSVLISCTGGLGSRIARTISTYIKQTYGDKEE